MIITLNLTIDDSVASQLIQDCGLSLGIQGSTDEEVVVGLKEKIRADLRALAMSGAEIRKKAEAKAAADALISSAVSVS